MNKLSRRAYVATVLALAVVVFFAVNIFADAFFTTARVDLTQDGEFTLSQGTRNIIAKLPEQMTLKFYYSRKIAAQYASTAAYGKRVRDLLAEYAALSHGKIVLEDVDPEPFTPEEDEASAAGLTGAPTDTGDNIYFGLVGTNSLDGKEIIPYFAQERAPYLEYDLSSLIYRLSTPKTPVLGLISSLPLESSGQPQQPLAIYSDLKANYKTVNIGTDFKTIPPGIDLLLIAHPVGLTDDGLAAIDQFVLGGGRALVFVDPVSEVTNHSAPGGMNMSPSSDLGPLLRSWGIAYDSGKVLADKALAQEVQAGPTGAATPYPLWIHLTMDNFNASDPVSANLQTLNLATTGVLAPVKGATTKFLPLVSSSDQATLVSRAAASSVSDPTSFMASLGAANQHYTIAARVTGTVKTAYPSRPGLKQSRGPVSVIVMADSDIFDDRFWVHQESLFGKSVAEPFADNEAFVLGAVENLFGSQDLISLRTRGTAQRPFVLVEKLKAAAQSEFQQTAQALQTRLNATQQHLQELQRGGNAGAPGSVNLSADQQGEIRRFQRELIDTRAQLRDVQHNLRKDIDSLGSILAFINIALVPLIIAGLALVLGLRRRRPSAKA